MTFSRVAGVVFERAMIEGCFIRLLGARLALIMFLGICLGIIRTDGSRSLFKNMGLGQSALVW